MPIDLPGRGKNAVTSRPNVTRRNACTLKIVCVKTAVIFWKTAVHIMVILVVGRSATRTGIPRGLPRVIIALPGTGVAIDNHSSTEHLGAGGHCARDGNESREQETAQTKFHGSFHSAKCRRRHPNRAIRLYRTGTCQRTSAMRSEFRISIRSVAVSNIVASMTTLTVESGGLNCQMARLPTARWLPRFAHFERYVRLADMSHAAELQRGEPKPPSPASVIA
jgi:hypothetical protein